MATPEGVWHLSRPLYKFNFEPDGGRGFNCRYFSGALLKLWKWRETRPFPPIDETSTVGRRTQTPI